MCPVIKYALLLRVPCCQVCPVVKCALVSSMPCCQMCPAVKCALLLPSVPCCQMCPVRSVPCCQMCPAVECALLLSVPWLNSVLKTIIFRPWYGLNAIFFKPSTSPHPPPHTHTHTHTHTHYTHAQVQRQHEKVRKLYWKTDLKNTQTRWTQSTLFIIVLFVLCTYINSLNFFSSCGGQQCRYLSYKLKTSPLLC